PPEPSPLKFLIEPSQMPKINSSDLEIIKLTALFTAQSGRRVVSKLSQREARNYQFDFLRPSNSLFGFFNRLVDQYTKIFIPSPKTLEHLEKLAGGKAVDLKCLDPTTLAKIQQERLIKGKREVMAEIQMHVDWENYQGLQLQKKTSEEEKEKKEFYEIDWEDFIVVSTVEFTENDEVIDLPPPMSISEVENMTIAQK
ncbi:Pre-mRNA splicing factor PRP21 like protein-domain-containing protein, partial [Phakopsora pachyrhizi]